MLLHQGAAAFTLWTGQPAPLDLMQAALDEARAGGVRVGRGRAGRRRSAPRPTGADAPDGADRGRPRRGTPPLPDRRRIARPSARRHVEGVPAGLALTADDLAVDLARRQRGYGRGARQAIEHDRAEIVAGRPPRADARLADPAPGRATATGRTGPQVMQVEPLDRRRGGRARGRGRGRQQAADPGHPRPARPRRPRRRAQVRLRRRPQRARAGVGPRDGRAGRRRRRRPGVPARARHRGLVVHRRGRRRRRRSRARRRCSREEADASPLRCPDPEAEARDDRPDRRGAVERRHGRRRLRGRRPRAADRARLVRPLGPPARRRAGRRGHEHQHRQGRRVRARVRADPPVRLAGPRRDRGPRRGRPLDPSHRTTPAA